MKPRQESFLPALKIRSDAAHGGDIAQGRRKTRRPLDSKRPVHLVLRASRARGTWSLLGHKEWIEGLIGRLEHRYKVRVYRHANVGNHLHLLLKTPSRPAFQGFLRELSGRIAMRVTGAVKGRGIEDLVGGDGVEARAPADAETSEVAGAVSSRDARSVADGVVPKPRARFWDHLAYTRLLTWGRQFETVSAYLIKNLFQAAGLYDARDKAAGARVLQSRTWRPRAPG